MIFRKNHDDRYLEKKQLEECEPQTELANPGRGWYHIYTFRVGKPDEEALRWLPFYGGETLALIRLDISDFRSSALSGEALAYIRKIFAVFREQKKEMLLRCCYDTEGKGLLREPLCFGQVQTHLGQLGKLVVEYADDICVSQGLLVGSWGEMHSSRYLDSAQIRAMVRIWQEATEGKVRLAMRRPCQLRMLEEDVCAGLYDDAIAGSVTDMGTFGEKPRREAAWEEAWQPEEELNYLQERCHGVPCGGEAVAGLTLMPEETINRLRKLRVSYLNSIYDPVRLDCWKAQTLPTGENLYDYIGGHMGYRFVVTEVFWKGGQLSVQIENKGFAPVCDATELFLECDGMRKKTECDLTLLLPGKSVTVRVECSGTGELQLGLSRKKDGAVIRFANAGAGEKLCIGTLLGKERKNGCQ